MVDYHRFQLGEVTGVVLRDGGGPRKAEQLFAHGPEGEREEALRALGVDPEAIQASFMPLYCDTGAQKIIVDTGLGVSEDPNRSGHMLEVMAAAGLDPQAIDVVIFTHMHGDHIMGNCGLDGQPTFPNARYIAWKSEWDYWSSPEVQAQRGEGFAKMWQKNMASLADRFEFIAEEGEILPGIEMITSHGHSPGHVALRITSGDQALLHVGDALHQPWHANFPDWGPGFDQDPLLAAESRRKLLRLAVDENLLMFAYHFQFPGLGHIAPWKDTWNWTALLS